MFKVLTIIAAGYIAVVLAMYLMQRSLLYLPARYADIDSAALAARRVQAWPDAGDYRGYLAIGETPGQNGSVATVVVFNGNAGSAIDRLYYHNALAFSGARVLLVEYPGYGRRSGSASEDVLVSEARSTLTQLAADYPADKLFVIGESLGAGVAAAAVGDENVAMHVDGMVLVTPWDSLAKVAGRHYWYLPVRWLLRDRYDNARNLAEFNKPKLLVIAGRDSIVPATHGLALFDSIPKPKDKLIIEGAGHNNWMSYVDEQWWREVWRYLQHGSS